MISLLKALVNFRTFMRAKNVYKINNWEVGFIIIMAEY